MPKFDVQTVRPNVPQPVAPALQSNIGQAVGAIGSAVIKLEQRKQKQRDLDDELYAREAALEKSVLRNQAVQEIKEKGNRENNLDSIIPGISEWENNYDSGIEEGKSDAFIRQYRISDNSSRRYAMDRAHQSVVKDRLDRVGQNITNSINILENNRDISIDGLFQDSGLMLDIAERNGMNDKVLDHIESALKTNISERVFSNFGTGVADEILDNPKVKQLFTPTEMAKQKEALSNQRAEVLVAQVADQDAKAYMGYQEVITAIDDKLNYAQVMSLVPKNLNDPATKRILDHIDKVYVEDRNAKEKVTNAEASFVEGKIKNSISDLNRVVNSKAFNDLGRQAKADKISVAVGEISELYLDAQVLYRNGDIDQDSFNKILIGYEEVIGKAYNPIFPETTGEGPVKRFFNSIGLTTPGLTNKTRLSSSVRDMTEKVESRDGLFKHFSNRDESTYISAYMASIIASDSFNSLQSATKDEIESTIESAHTDATNAVSTQNHPGIPREKRERIERNRENIASKPTTTNTPDPNSVPISRENEEKILVFEKREDISDDKFVEVLKRSGVPQYRIDQGLRNRNNITELVQEPTGVLNSDVENVVTNPVERVLNPIEEPVNEVIKEPIGDQVPSISPASRLLSGDIDGIDSSGNEAFRDGNNIVIDEQGNRTVTQGDNTVSIQGSSDLENRILIHEGSVLDDVGNHIVYRDTEGNLTVGFGHLVLDSDNLIEGQKISKERAEELFRSDIQSAVDQAEQAVDNFDSLPQEAQEVLIEMVFQMGLAGVKKFNNMRAALNESPPDFKTASEEMLDSRWAKQTPSRAEELASIIEGLA